MQGRNAGKNEAIMAKNLFCESQKHWMNAEECALIHIPPHPHTPEPLRDPEVGGPGTAISESLAQKIHLQSLKKLTANSPNH